MQILFDNWTGRYDDECLMPGDIVEAAMVYNFRENAGNQTDTMIQMSEVADIVGNLPFMTPYTKRTDTRHGSTQDSAIRESYRIEIRHSCRCAISAADTGQIPERNWKKISKWRSGQQAR